MKKFALLLAFFASSCAPAAEPVFAQGYMEPDGMYGPGAGRQWSPYGQAPGRYYYPGQFQPYSAYREAPQYQGPILHAPPGYGPHYWQQDNPYRPPTLRPYRGPGCC